MATIQELREIKAKYEAMLKSEGKAILGGAFKSFFDACPNVDAVRWRQYTPYFNDGDVCTFRLREPTFRFVEVPESVQDGLDEYGDDFCEVWGDATSALGISEEADQQLNSVFDDDVMLAVFGDHVQVTATREGFFVDEYDHD